jgi:hypothetical protein
MSVVPLRYQDAQFCDSALMRLQRVQQAHDELAHRDILSFNLHKRLKHMVLHFYKYTGKIQAASEVGDVAELRRTLIDAFIICMASANAMNLSLDAEVAGDDTGELDGRACALGKSMPETLDVFGVAVRQFALIGGRMAKVVESADHMELGDPRQGMQVLVPRLTEVILALLGQLGGNLERDIRQRLADVEAKSIFRQSPARAK